MFELIKEREFIEVDLNKNGGMNSFEYWIHLIRSGQLEEAKGNTQLVKDK